MEKELSREEAFKLIVKVFEECGKKELRIREIANALGISEGSAQHHLSKGEEAGLFTSKLIIPPYRARAYSLAKKKRENK